MEVYTFGNGDFLQQVFVAVTSLMGTGSFMTLVRLTVMLSMLVLAYQLFFSLRADLVISGFFKHYFIVVVLFYALMVPKTNVIIWDEYRAPNAMPAVNNVPFGVALFANIFTTAERGLTKMMETSFSTPDDLKFSNSGFAFSVIALDNMKYATTTDPYFKRTMDDYVVNCFFTDVLWGDKDLNIVLTSNDIFSQLNPTHSAPLMSMAYSATYPMGQQDSCQDIYNTITANMGATTSAALSKLSDTMGIDVASRLPTVMNSVLNVATTAQGAVKQAMVANSLKDGLAQTAMYTGVSGDAVAYATALAQQQQQSQWTIAGELSKKYIPILRQILEAVVYGIFPILFLMMMTPWGRKSLQMYVSLLMWLLMWSPLFALLNLIVNTRSTSVLKPSIGYFSMGNMPYIYQSTADVTAMAGYMAWLVPTLAFAIAKVSDSALVHAMSSVAASTNLTQSHAASATVGPEGASRTAAAAAQFQAAGIYGSHAVMSGIAAQHTYGMQYGMAMENLGTADSMEMAQNQVKSSAFTSRASAAGIDVLTESIGDGDIKKTAAITGNVGAQRQAGELKSLLEASAPHGGIENFARALADKNYAQASSVIERYAHSKGISFDKGAQDVGRILGDRDALGAEAFQKMQSTVGREAQVFTEINKGLNEVAKFEQTYEFAHSAGYAGSKEDFQGVFKGHLSHHAQETWTLDNQRADWLNGQMEAHSSPVRFHEGDRVTMSRGSDGMISLAKGESGAVSDSFNLTRAQSGTDISEVSRKHQELNLGASDVRQLADDVRHAGPGYNNFAKGLDQMADKYGGAKLSLDSTAGGKLVGATARAGGEAVSIDYRNQKTGWENFSHAIDKSESGSLRQIYDNFTNKVGGSHDISFNDFREVMSGLKDMGFDVRISESASASGGHRVMIQDPHTKQAVAGDIKSVVTEFKQTVDGATHEVKSPTGGEPIVSKSEVGSERTQLIDRLNMRMGVSADGTVTQGVRNVGSEVFGKETGETIAVGTSGIIDGASTLGKTVGGFRSLGIGSGIGTKGDIPSDANKMGPYSEWPIKVPPGHMPNMNATVGRP